MIEGNFQQFKIEFITSGPKRSTTTQNSLYNKLLKCFPKNNKIIKNGNDIFEHDKATKDYAEKIAKDIMQLIRDKGDQEEYWIKNYGVDKKIYTIEEGGRASTFFLFPGIDFDKKLTPKECIERMDRWVQKYFKNARDVKLDNKQKDLTEEKKDKEKIREFIGISDNQGGLSQIGNTIFELLLKEDIESIKSIFTDMSSTLWKGKEAELDERLRWLSKQARKVGKPQVVGNWGDYRSDVGGKIQSWVSNTQGQDEKIHKALFGYEEKKYDPNTKQIKTEHKKGHKDEIEQIINTGLEDMQKNFNAKADLEYNEEDKRIFDERILDISNNILPALETTLQKIDGTYQQNKKIDIQILLDYREQLTRLKTQLNFLFQWAYGGQEEEDESDTKKKGKQKTVDDEYKILFKNLPKIPSFFGEVKLRKDDGEYVKYMRSYDRVVSGIDFFIDLHNQNKTLKKSGDVERDSEKITHSLQQLLSAYRNARSKKGRGYIIWCVE